MKILVAALLACFGSHVLAGETVAPAELPPSGIVARVLRAHPVVQAAASQIHVEEANRTRLEAGPYEWNIRLGAQQRKFSPSAGPNERFNEWNTALERPLRLPGKGAIDGELGAAGVALANIALGDALHETSRSLLQAWFTWLKESAAASQWRAQFSLLEKQAQTVQRRQQLGDAARLETIQSDAALAQAAAQLTQAEVRQHTAAEDLRRRYPGLPLLLPKQITEPPPIAGSEKEWLATMIEHNHELGLARAEAQRWQIAAERSKRDRLPDPTVGIHVARERSGEDQIIGAYISIPLPGSARRTSTDAALAQVNVATHREAAAHQKVSAEASHLYQAASAARSSWQASHGAAERLSQAAEMTARAYQLGEGSLNDLLTTRRLANEAQLAARLLQLEALELRYRLLLDAHQLWDLDDESEH